MQCRNRKFEMAIMTPIKKTDDTINTSMGRISITDIPPSAEECTDNSLLKKKTENEDNTSYDNLSLKELLKKIFSTEENTSNSRQNMKQLLAALDKYIIEDYIEVIVQIEISDIPLYRATTLITKCYNYRNNNPKCRDIERKACCQHTPLMNISLSSDITDRHCIWYTKNSERYPELMHENFDCSRCCVHGIGPDPEELMEVSGIEK